VTGKNDILLDTSLSRQSSVLTSLLAAHRAGELARQTGRFEEFRRQVQSFVRNGGFAQVGQFNFIRKLDKRNDQELREVLKHLKFGGIDNFERPNELFSNARILASRITLSKEMSNHLFANSRAKGASRADWENSVKTAFAIQHLIVDGGISEAAQNELVDEQAKQTVLEQLDQSKGALVLLCHAGFSTVRFSFLKDHINNIIYMASTASRPQSGRGAPDRISVNLDARAGLFAGLKALLQKKVVLLAPDGKQGAQKSSISVLGKKTPIGEGAAFLAYESKCDTFWFAMKRSDERFIPVMMRGPSRLKAEKFPEFQDRFVQFYEDMLNDFFSGDPRNLMLTPRWARVFSDKEGRVRRPPPERSLSTVSN
jgi:hypothetical protein